MPGGRGTSKLARASVSRKGNVRRRVKPCVGRSSSSAGPNPSTARSASQSTSVASVRQARATSWPRRLGHQAPQRPGEPLLPGADPLPEDPGISCPASSASE